LPPALIHHQHKEGGNMTIDKSKFIASFKEETKEHILKINEGLLALEKDNKDKDVLEALMREAHTIKGSATMMGFEDIVEITHRMEEGFEKALKQQLVIEEKHFDVLFESIDAVEALIEDKKGKIDVEDLCKRGDEIFFGKENEKVEDNAAEEETSEDKKTTYKKTSKDTEESLRVGLEKLDNLMNLAGTLHVAKIGMKDVVKGIIEESEATKSLGESFVGMIKELKTLDENMDFIIATLQREVMNLRMVPISKLFKIFPRAMRDLSRERGKDIDLEIQGEDTFLDKNIVDAMKDPLLHILRNAVDHGIEKTEDRKEKGKDATGKIILKAYQKAQNVVIEVSDDGSGIDIEKIKKYAVDKNIVTKEDAENMSEQQLYQLLFLSGFTTEDEVDDVSGRGVGMDVVYNIVKNLKGSIEISSVPEKGTTFIIKLPITLAITESLIVEVGSEVFAVPVDDIVETVRVAVEDINAVETKKAITRNGEIIPLVNIKDVFGIARKGISEEKHIVVVIVQCSGRKIGVQVDAISRCQDIISKPLGRILGNIENIAGGSILGDGKVILIIDVPSIINFTESGVIKNIVQAPTVKAAKRTKNKKKTILLAEDAISTAMLEKNILESAGFSVVIASDGEEAFKIAHQERFDLVITDVLMPKMNGFELTEKLKNDKVYKDIPIIIVTTRAKDADKRRGLEAGAEAYILKSEFTSDALLNTIERLIG